MTSETGRTRASSGSGDVRALRSADALHQAAVDLVTSGRRVSVAALAEASGRTRQTVYLHYPDANSVVLAATRAMLDAEVVGGDGTHWPGAAPPPVLVSLAQHLDTHRDFYRRVLEGPIAHDVSDAIAAYFRPGTRQRIEDAFGDRLPRETLDDLATFLHAGIRRLLTDWVMDPGTTTPSGIAGRCWLAARLLSERVPTTGFQPFVPNRMPQQAPTPPMPSVGDPGSGPTPFRPPSL
ncbi:TetR-like C-terminal domain-containing protein [Nocardioides sp. YIM 152588]|uniref:TetR/AcrR family transcriptional regulator n=1 Tax=Nocardioides sp. YIM 152588 TaxID=3158259 RepID=UPI0032E4CEAD